MKRYFLSFLLAVFSVIAYAETATLSPNRQDFVVNKSGTVTFKNYGVTLEETAKQYQLKHISGTKYKAAIIYSCSFEGGRGKVYNCTDKSISVKCEFYYGNSLIQTSTIEVAPRTFQRIVIPKTCDKIICKD